MDAADVFRLCDLADGLSAEPVSQDQDVVIPRTVGLDYPEANRVYYGTPSGPITPGTVGSYESVARIAVQATAQKTADMGETTGGQTMPESGYTRVTLVINNGTYGRAESHTLQKSVSDPNTPGSALALVAQRALILGDDNNGTVKTLGGPQVEFVRIADAINLRNGRVLKGVNAPGSSFGPGRTASYAADFFATAITFRMASTPSSGGGPPVVTTVQLVGQPDDCVLQGKPNFAALVAPGTSWWGACNTYLSYLLGNAQGQFGIMLQDPAQVKLPVVSWAVVAGAWQLTIPGNNYNAGDRIRLTQVNVRGFNGQYTIAGVAGTLVTISNGPPISIPVPTQGKAQRYQFSNGTRALIFAPYTTLVNGPSAQGASKVSKKNPGRQLLGVSFRRKARRLH